MTTHWHLDKLLISFLGIAGMIDAISSLVLFRGGYAQETNPLLSWASPEGVALIRLVTVLVSIAILERFRYYPVPWARPSLLAVSVCYSLVLAHHAVVWVGVVL